MYQFRINCCCSSSFICRDTNYEDMLGLCKEEVIRTAKEHITCRSHNGNLRSLRSLRSHGIHHGSLHSHSRARPQPHAFRRLPCIQDCIHHILRIHHGSHRILRSRSRAQRQPWAQPQPHAFRRLPCIQARIHHILHIHHGSLRIHRSRSRAQRQPWAQPQPHACHRLPCIQDRIHHILRIPHGSLRILRSRSRAQPQPHAFRTH